MTFFPGQDNPEGLPVGIPLAKGLLLPKALLCRENLFGTGFIG